MVSTLEQEDLATLFPGVQPLSLSDPVQTVSLRDVNNEDSTTYPPHQQQLPLPAFNPASTNASTLPIPAQSVPPAQDPNVSAIPQTLLKKPEKYNNIGLSKIPVKKRGRGYTGRKKGRPKGSKNKPKGPDHGLPKMPKKKGRPPGSKNKHPRGAHNAYIPGPENNNDLIEERSQQLPIPNLNGLQQAPIPPVAENTALMATSIPTQAQTTYQYPVGYAPITDSSDLFDNDAGFDQATDEWHSSDAQPNDIETEHLLANAITSELSANSSSSALTPPQDFMTSSTSDPSDFFTTPSRSTPPSDFMTSSASTPPEDFMTPRGMPYCQPTSSPYANSNQHGQPDYGYGYQYPPPPQLNHAFGNSNFTYGNGNININVYNNSNSNSSNIFPPPSHYPEGMSAYPWPAQPVTNTSGYGHTDLSAPTTSQVYNASSLLTGTDNDVLTQQPYSYIDPALDTGPQNNSPPPATSTPHDDNFASLFAEFEKEYNNLTEEDKNNLIKDNIDNVIQGAKDFVASSLELNDFDF